MDQRITFVTIGVKDLEAMKQFYNTCFGWKPLKDNDGIVFYKLNGMILGLFPANELAEDIGIESDGSGFKQMTLAINLRSEAEVDSAFHSLIANGAVPVLKPEKVFWGGYRGYIADPENNYWELAYNPFLKLDSSGNVITHE